MAISKHHIEVYTGGYFQTNGYAVPLAEEGEILLIDAPEGVADWVAGKGWRVTALLLTHLHYDHVIDAAKIRVAYPDATFCSHSSVDADLTLETVLRETIGWPFDLGEFSIDELLADRFENGLGHIEVAGQTLGLLHVPGHSPDSVAFYLTESGLLFSGDALFHRSIGRTDFPHGDSDTLLSSIRKRIFPLPGETVVYPGHGPETTVAEEKAGNPYVRP